MRVIVLLADGLDDLTAQEKDSLIKATAQRFIEATGVLNKPIADGQVEVKILEGPKQTVGPLAAAAKNVVAKKVAAKKAPAKKVAIKKAAAKKR